MLHVYRASAGSGKTYRLTLDYIRLLFKASGRQAHRRVMAVTFTNKATDEMKVRILNELHAISLGGKSNYRAILTEEFQKTEEEINKQAGEILTAILHDYSSFSISTIDRFFQQVIRSFARDIGVNGGYNLELDNSLTLEQSVDNMFVELSQTNNKQLLAWLTQFAEDRIEQSEGWNLKKSILSLGNEIFKESYQHKAEATNKKLHDKEFLFAYRKKLRTISTDFEQKLQEKAQHALDVMRQYELRHEDFSYSTTKVLESYLQLKKMEIGKRFGDLADDVANCYTKKTPEAIKAKIESAYSNGLQSAFVETIRLLEEEIIQYNSAQIVLKHISTLGILSDLAMQIKTLTEEQNTLLISDTNLLLNKIIDGSDAPFVYEKTGLFIDHFMIDEFQDTSVLQWKNFYPLIHNSLSGGNFNLLVGDVKQSIYRWRNSDWKLLDEQVLQQFRKEQIHEENLDTNWRSDKNIVAFNNRFFEFASHLLQQKLNENIASLVTMYPALKELLQKITHAYKNTEQKTKENAKEGYLRFEFLPQKDEDENWREQSLNRIPVLLESLQDRGYAPHDVCILVRKNDEEQAVVNKLLNYKSSPEANQKYCYNIMGNEGLLIGSACSVRFIVALLHLFLNDDDTIHQAIASYEYAVGRLNKTENEALNYCFRQDNNTGKGYLKLFSVKENIRLRQIQHLSLFEMVEQTIALFGIGAWKNEAVFVQAFQDVVYQFSAKKSADLNSFLSWWKKNSEKQCVSSPEGQNAFRIMTIHKSKGLDFKVVFMPFADWGMDSKMRNIIWCEPKETPFDEIPLIPIEYSSKLNKTIFAENYFDEQMHQYIDNINLAYVAFTRAEHELICLLPQSEDKTNNLSELIGTFLENQENEAIFSSFRVDEEKNILEIGTPTSASVQKGVDPVEEIKIDNYPICASGERLQLRHCSTDYWLLNQQMTDSRLNYGLIMHDILKQMNSRHDEEKAIRTLLQSGRVNQSDVEHIRAELGKFWEVPETREWFAPDAQILNEIPILTPTGAQYRPDRVVLKNNKAIIIDYKFGEEERKSYLQQVKQYMNLVGEMNLQVEGFIYYISLGKVVSVN